MTLTVRLPDRVEQELAEYCVKHRITKSAAVKRAIEDLLQQAQPLVSAAKHPFIGIDRQVGDVARHTKRLLREHFRGKGSGG